MAEKMVTEALTGYDEAGNPVYNKIFAEKVKIKENGGLQDTADGLAGVIATKENPGIVKVGEGLKAEADGTLSLDDNLISYARLGSTEQTFEAGISMPVKSYTLAESYGENISVSEDGTKIVLKAGLYHVDAQFSISVEDLSATYYNAVIETDRAPKRMLTYQIDGSYKHTEILSLSFDANVTPTSEGGFTFMFSELPPGAIFKVKDINIHELITVAGDLVSNTGDYTNGDGITIDNSAISVNAGKGLKFDAGKLQVALGKGLKFEEDVAVGVDTLSLDQPAEETIQAVNKMTADLDTKITTAYPYAAVSVAADMTNQGSTNGTGVLIGHLFSVPINNKIYVSGDNAKLVTTIGVFAKQEYTQNYIILGLYEYDPEYEHKDTDGNPTGVKGRTVAFCDTGRVKLVPGLNEFEIKHFNNNDGETTKELKAGCLYYAAIYISKNPGAGILLAARDGYDTTFNTVPTLTSDQVNINIDLSAEGGDNVSFNDFGFGWGGTQTYHELPGGKRIFMQIRNKAIL